MAITLQQIADLAGVSRETVDRALNNRGRIKPEVEQRIKKTAKDVGYKPGSYTHLTLTTSGLVQI